MAQNDMFVVMYKVLAYLYDCMKRGEAPETSCWDASAFGIPEAYWKNIVVQLVEHGLVGGISLLKTKDGIRIRPIEPFVTMEGVQFAQENSMMAKAAGFLRDAKAAIPFI